MTQITTEQTIDGLTAVLKALIAVRGADGRRVLYQSDETGDHGYCEICKEVDAHRPTCAVGHAEDALRRLGIRT